MTHVDLTYPPPLYIARKLGKFRYVLIRKNIIRFVAYMYTGDLSQSIIIAEKKINILIRWITRKKYPLAGPMSKASTLLLLGTTMAKPVRCS